MADTPRTEQARRDIVRDVIGLMLKDFRKLNGYDAFYVRANPASFEAINAPVVVLPADGYIKSKTFMGVLVVEEMPMRDGFLCAAGIPDHTCIWAEHEL